MGWLRDFDREEFNRHRSEQRNNSQSSTVRDKSKQKLNSSLALRVVIPSIFLVSLLLIGVIIFKYIPTFKSISLADNIIIKIFILLNIVTFIIFWIDKIFANIECIRFPNIVLYSLAAIGGGIGSRLARLTFRHKVVDHYAYNNEYSNEYIEDKKYKFIYNLIEPLSLIFYILLFIAFY